MFLKIAAQAFLRLEIFLTFSCKKFSCKIRKVIKFHFSYCRLIWMFCNQKIMRKVNKIQERYLRLMANNCELSCEELLDLTNDISPQQQCLNSLMTEVYRCQNWLSPDIMNHVLSVSKHRCSSRHYNLFVTDQPKTDRFDQNSILQRASQKLNLLSREIKNSPNLDSLKLKIKQWRCLDCPCTLCKTYFLTSNFIS